MVPENTHTPPTEGIGNSREEGGVLKTQKFKAMYEAKLEFPVGPPPLPGYRTNPFHGGGMDIFWNNTIENNGITNQMRGFPIEHR